MSEQVFALQRVGGEPIPLEPGVALTIGRHPDRDLTIPVRSVSRLHAELAWEEGKPVLVNHSANGSYVNGCTVDRHALHEGDEIRIGPFRCKVIVRSGGLLDDDEAMTIASEDPTQSGKVGPGVLRELLQRLEANEQTATLHVSGLSDGQRGWVAIRDGQLLSAQLGALVDEQAVRALLAEEVGRFIVLPDVRERRILRSISDISPDDAGEQAIPA